MKSTAIVTEDPWLKLRRYTEARIGLGRCGSSLPLEEVLRFRLAHAQARDAVHLPLDRRLLEEELVGHDLLWLASSVMDRSEFLTRPDKGRVLDGSSRERLATLAAGYDLCLVISDGLSARAIHENGAPFLRQFCALATTAGLKLSPVCIVENGRVAVADEVGQRLQARLAVILIGERPGLKAPNSMGIYLTWQPQPGTPDARRNCISNIRAGGLEIEKAVVKTAYLVEQAFAVGETGIGLKDRMEGGYIPFAENTDWPGIA